MSYNSHFNKHLVPMCIIYVNGVRLDAKFEGAFRSIRIIDVMNKAGICTIIFDYQEIFHEANKKNGTFELGSELSVHLGYKDDTDEVFYGEITGVGISIPKYSSSTFIVKVSPFIQRLGHAKRNRVFENITPSQAISDLASRFDLQAECDS